MPSPCFLQHDQLRNVPQRTQLHALTSAVDGGEWSVSHLHSSLLGIEPPVFFTTGGRPTCILHYWGQNHLYSSLLGTEPPAFFTTGTEPTVFFTTGDKTTCILHYWGQNHLYSSLLGTEPPVFFTTEDRPTYIVGI
jgi:hypothetical protein